MGNMLVFLAAAPISDLLARESGRLRNLLPPVKNTILRTKTLVVAGNL